MKTDREPVYATVQGARVRAAEGFSIIELLVAMAVFLIVAAAAFSLFSQNTALATHQQTLSSVNIGLRNAISQMEMDLSGAGQNVLGTVQGAAGQFSPGVIIRNNVPGVSPACVPNAATWGYPAASACFDSLTTIATKQCTVAGVATSAPVLALDGGESLWTSTTSWANDPNAGAVLANEVGCYQNGDEILVLEMPNSGTSFVACDPYNGNTQSNFCLGAYTLSANASVAVDPTSGNTDIELPHLTEGIGSDPLGIIFNSAGVTNYERGNTLVTPVPSASYVIDVGTGSGNVTYAVQANPINAADMQLVRCPGSVCTVANAQVLVDQIIGFKVGADLYASSSAPTDLASYSYNSATYCNGGIETSVGPPPVFVNCDQTPQPAAGLDPYDFALIRSIRVSLIGRTPPGGDLDLTKSKFQNGFDGGPYLVQQASVIVNLRGISISNFGN